jgi:type IV pilus assembly protein PilC
MNKSLMRLLTASAVLSAVLTAIGGLSLLLFHFVGPVAVPLLLLLSVGYGWIIYAVLQYQHGRQEEVVQLLAAGAEAGAPLAPLVDAYLRDRPSSGWRKFWDVLFLIFVLPGYELWRPVLSSDEKARRLANRLRDGASLHEALRAIPGVVPPGVVISAAVGESTGRLADCLRRANRVELGPVWMNVVPRLLYPAVLLLFVLGILAFWTTMLLPRMQRIYFDFQMVLPEQTQQLLEAGRFLKEYGWIVSLALLGGVVLVLALIVSPTIRWYTPVVGRLYRMSVQSRVLSMLGVLLETGRPVPQALRLLADQEESGGVIQERLEDVEEAVSEGKPLAESLGKAGLLSRSGVALVQAGERARNLPWVLAELGEQLAARTVRLSQQLSLAMFPIAVVAIGIVVGFLVVGMFLPLLKLITELS